MIVLTDHFRRDRAPMEGEAGYPRSPSVPRGKARASRRSSNDGELGGVLVLTVSVDEAKKIAIENPPRRPWLT